MTSQLLTATALLPASQKCLGYRARNVADALSWVPKALRAIENELSRPVALLALPAGFFGVDSFSRGTLQDLSAAVFGAGVTPAIATVVDAGDFGLSSRHLKPSYGVVMMHGSILGEPVQQTSWTGAEGRKVREEDAQGQIRVHDIAGISVGLLCCGEIFSPVVRAALIRQRPAAVINMAHRQIEDYDPIKETWCNHLRQLSANISAWALFAGASTDPETATYNYQRGAPVRPAYQCRVENAGAVLRCFLVGRSP